MKKSIILLASLLMILLVNPFKSFAGDTKKEECKNQSTSISGQVFDKKTGETLAGALISIDGTDFKTYTDLDGNFNFAGMNPGSYSVSVSMISYETNEVENILLNAGESKKLDVQILSY